MLASVQITSGTRAFTTSTPPVNLGSAASGSTSFQNIMGGYHSPAADDLDEANRSETISSEPKSVAPAAPRKEQSPAPSASKRPETKSESEPSDSTGQVQETDTTEALAKSTAERGATFRALLRKLRAMDAANSQQPKSTDNVSAAQKNTADGTATVPLIPIRVPEPVPTISPLTTSLTLRQTGDDAKDISAASAESATAADTPLQDPVSFSGVQEDDKTSPSNSLAFAARLTPSAESISTKQALAPAPARIPTSESASTAEHPQAHNAHEAVSASTAKQLLASDGWGGSGDSANTSGGDSKPQQNPSEMFALTHASVIPASAAVQNEGQPNGSTASNSDSQGLSAGHLDKTIDTPAPAPNSNHDITVRIPDAMDQSTSVRFLERGGEVHVSVRTTDSEIAQTLRGGLNDLVNRLQDGGIQTEIWQPGSDASTSHDAHQNAFTNPDGSNGNSSGSNSEGESSQQQKPRWLEELESSIGSEKETQQLWPA